MAKQFPYEIIDPEALKTAHPEFYRERVVTKTVIDWDKEGLYMQIKLDQRAGRPTPGVVVKKPEPAPLDNTPQSPSVHPQSLAESPDGNMGGDDLSAVPGAVKQAIAQQQE